MYQRYRDKGVTVVAVNPGKMMMGGESPEMVKRFAEQTSITFPIGFDNGESYKELRHGNAISPFPMDIIIDQEGRIAYHSRKYDADAIISVIEKLQKRTR